MQFAFKRTLASLFSHSLSKWCVMNHQNVWGFFFFCWATSSWFISFFKKCCPVLISCNSLNSRQRCSSFTFDRLQCKHRISWASQFQFCCHYTWSQTTHLIISHTHKWVRVSVKSVSTAVSIYFFFCPSHKTFIQPVLTVTNGWYHH